MTLLEQCEELLRLARSANDHREYELSVVVSICLKGWFSSGKSDEPIINVF